MAAGSSNLSLRARACLQRIARSLDSGHDAAGAVQEVVEVADTFRATAANSKLYTRILKAARSLQLGGDRGDAAGELRALVASCDTSRPRTKRGATNSASPGRAANVAAEAKAWIVLDENGFPAFYDEDAGTAGVCKTEREAQEDIVGHYMIQLEQFRAGEREFEDIDIAQFSYVSCDVSDQGDISTESFELTRGEIRSQFGVSDDAGPSP